MKKSLRGDTLFDLVGSSAFGHGPTFVTARGEARPSPAIAARRDDSFESAPAAALQVTITNTNTHKRVG